MLSSLVYIFCEILLLRTQHTFFCKFHKGCTSQPPWLWWQTSVQAWSILFDFAPLRITSKQTLMWDWNIFCYKPISNNANFISMKKNSEKDYFAFYALIYWIILVYTIGSSVVKKWSYLSNEPRIYNRSLHGQKMPLFIEYVSYI